MTYSLILLALAINNAWAGRVYDSEEKERYWNIFLRTKTDSPAEEMALARSLKEAERNRAARRRFRAVVRYWPTSDEAPQAQLAIARLIDNRRRSSSAFDAYQKLFDKFPGSFSVDKVLERQFELAVKVKNARKFRFIFGGLADPIESVPMFESIIENAPGWRRAPNAQFLIGQAYEKAGKPEQAVPAYQAVELNYPNDPLAPKAAFYKCRLLVELSRKYRNDNRLREKAYSELVLFTSKYPDSDDIDEALRMKREQYERVAEAAFDVADYYEKRGRNKSAALSEYERFLEEHPNSHLAAKAARRIEMLSRLLGDHDE